jgi:anti-anti-sigma factor
MSLERQPGAPRWTDDDRELAEEIAVRAALAVDNAMLLAEERAAGERLTLLQRATAELSAAATPAEVADVTVRHLAQLLGPTVSLSVLEYDPTTQTLAALSLYGAGERPDHYRLDLRGPGLVPAALRAGSPLWLDGDRPGTQDPVLEELVRSYGLRGAAGLPLVAAGRVVGGIGIGLDDRSSLSPSERTTVLALTEPCASALERARLYRAEHDIAQTLQRSLLPQELPELGRLALAARYLPGAENTQAGGDWYDVVELDDGRVAIAVGDVVGQGTPAAAVMGQLRTALSGYLLAGEGPAAALELLDRLTARIPGARASTALCMVLEPTTGRLLWSRAGHLPALVVDAAGARYLDGSAGHGALLGLPPGRPPYTDGELALAPGSSLVLYTDGLVERRGESLDEGLARLAAAARGHAARDPESLATALLADLADPGGADDIALIIARRTPEPLSLRLPARPEELAGMRRRVHEWAGGIGLDDDTAEDLQLALGEAATNAVEHAYRNGAADQPGDATSGGSGDEVGVRLTRHGDGSVVVEVRDHGSWRPVPEDPGYRGRGLTLIRAIGEEVTISSGAEGTTVSFLVRPPVVATPGHRGPDAVGSSPAVGVPATLTVADEDPGRRIDLWGDLDAAGVRAVREELASVLDDADRPLVLDLGGVGYLASAGVGLLLEALERGRQRGVDVDLRARGGPPARILALVRAARSPE